MTTYDLTSSTPSKIQTGDIINCPYSGTYKQITLPKGTYKLEVWGARGGGYQDGNTSAGYGGKGGYSYGTLQLQSNTVLYLYSGGIGSVGYSSTQAGGFNGGGSSYGSSSGEPGCGGGGASDIRIGTNSLYARVIVAGGGGGGGEDTGDTVGYGGGTSGGASGYDGSTATQTAAGTGASFGTGRSTGYADGGGGGGGWYGGGSGYSSSTGTDSQGGGGGSGYVYTSSTVSNYPSGCLLNSSYYLTDASTINGGTSFTSPSGSSETGHDSSGYCRITVIECGGIESYVKVESVVPSGYTQLEYIESTGTQYINTGYCPNQDTGIDLNFTFTSTGSWQCLVGAANASSNLDSYSIWHSGSYFAFYYASVSQSWSVNSTERHHLSTRKNVAILDEQTIEPAYSTFDTNYPLYLCASHRADETPYTAKMRIYSCKIYDNGTIVRNFVPCTNPSGTVGLYDLVNDEFYTDSNGNAFVAGDQYISSWKKIKSVLIKRNGEWVG